MGSLASKVKAFLILSRIPFLVPGLAPFAAGLLLARWEGVYNAPAGLVALSAVGLIVIMLATYYSNEYFDFEGDVINRFHNRFSGGSRALSDGLLPREAGKAALVASLLLLAALTGLYAALYLGERPLLLAYILLGVVMGVFYSGPPFRWAYRGLGELMIAVAYGVLAVTSGYYVASGRIDRLSILLSLPAAFSVFSVIVINEVPDYPADARVGKRNLVARLGRERALALYAVSNILTLASAAAAAYALSGPLGSAAALLLLAALGVPATLNAASLRVLESPALLERTCGLTIVFNALAPIATLAAALL